MAETATFGLKVMSSNGVFYDGRAACVIVPAEDGEHALLAHHEELLAAIYSGTMQIKGRDGNWIKAAISEGTIQFANNRCIILADTVERPEDIDMVRARKAMEEAQEQLRQKQSWIEYKESEAALSRALSRLRTGNLDNKYL